VKHDIPIGETIENFHIHSLGVRMCTKEMIHQVPIELGGHTFPTSMLILKDQDIDVILGMNWMHQHGAMINTLNRTIRLNLSDSTSQLLIQLPTPKRAVERVCATTIKEIENIPIV
jgi:hypothetical protein